MAYLRSRNKPEWANRPVPENAFLWTAFRHLQRSRNMNGHVPISEINAYCEFAGIDDPVQRSRLLTVVMALNEMEPAHAAKTAD